MTDPMTDKSRTRAPAQEKPIPTRDDLLREALHVYELALEMTYDRDGETYSRPELPSAIKALELAGRLIGALGDGKNMSVDQLRNELDRLGWKLVPKKEPKVA